MTETWIVCRCARDGKLPSAAADALCTDLTDKGVTFTEVDDLCALVAGQGEDLRSLFAGVESARIFACRPRAVRWLLHRGGVDLPELQVHSLLDPVNLPEPLPAAGEAKKLATDPDTNPWGPAIDYDRCTNCAKCLNFCLFGVYGKSLDGQVQVEKPQYCKDKCPACARVCPTSAIIFPKITETPFDGSEPEENAGNSGLEEDLQTDLYAALAARRKKSGLSLLKTDALAQAEAERARCAEGSEATDCGCDCDCKSDASGDPSRAPSKDCNCDCENCTDCTCEDDRGCDCEGCC